MIRLLALLLGLATWEWFLVPFPPPLPAYVPRPRAGPEGTTPQVPALAGFAPAIAHRRLRSRRRTRERRGAVFLREHCNRCRALRSRRNTHGGASFGKCDVRRV